MKKSRTRQNPEWAKSRIGKNRELDEIPNWIKSRIGQNVERTKSRIRQNPEWTKSRMKKIPNGINPELTTSKIDRARINSVLTAGL